ncbi:MAG: pyridoxamine 5'-phosphate oxidase family protein [Acidimicrobiales bacterium]
MTTTNATNISTSGTTDTSTTGHRPDPRAIRRAMAKRSFCTLATVSPAGRPHVAGVIYGLVGDALYVSTERTSRKARNIAHSPHVAVVIPVRRVPAGGPPSAIQFQATATLLAVDDPEIERLRSAGTLGSITGHGELDLPDSCFVRIALPRRLHTYGLGMSLLSLIRHPLDGAGQVDLTR